MARIVMISGVDDIPETPLRISGFETEGEMDLKIARQSAELEHGLAERIAGIGSPEARGVSRTVKQLNAALRVVHDGDQVAGIGALIGKTKAGKQKVAPKPKAAKKAEKKQAKKVAKQAKAAKKPARTGKTKRVANLLKSAGKKIKSGAKAFVKVATAPQRLLVKGMGEVFIPKMAPMFLYLFITNQSTIANLPAAVKRKRLKAEKFAKFMTKVVGMKQDHFMKLVRNGIVRKKKQTPEQLLSLYIKGSISGPGVGDIGVIDDIITVVIEVIQQLVKVFGKKPAADETPSKDDMPDLENDFREMADNVKREVLTHLEYKPESQKGYPAAPPDMEAKEQAQEESALQQVRQEPADTPVTAPLPTPESDPADDAEPDSGTASKGEQPAGQPGGGSSTSSLLIPLVLAGGVAVLAAK